MKTQRYILVVMTILLSGLFSSHNAHASFSEGKVRAAITRVLRPLGYEVTERRPGGDAEAVELEYRDSAAYSPSSRMLFRLRSLQPWARNASTYFRYSLIRETYESQAQAEKRVREYKVDYHKRLETEEMSDHKISKTIIRVDAKRRGLTVYLLVTDGQYTFTDDKKQGRILDTLIKARST